MTFKTDIKFDDSPVLRSLERVAINKGLITIDPVVKTASHKSAYKPTNDLDEDLFNLVAGLRAKGLFKAADDLEDKINICRFAKSKLVDKEIMDQAHPDGDVEVAESASGLGKVWTEQSAQEEILKIVNKKPTGKNAKLNHGIVKTAMTVDDAKIWINQHARKVAKNIMAQLNNLIDNNPDHYDMSTDLTWGDEGQDSSESDSDIENYFTAALNDYLKIWAGYGYHPEDLSAGILKGMTGNWSGSTWYDGEDLSVGELFNGGRTGAYSFFTVSIRRLEGFEDTVAVDVEDLIINKFNPLIKQYKSIIVNTDIPDKNRVKAKELRSELKAANKAVVGSTTIDQVVTALSSIITDVDWSVVEDASDLSREIGKQVNIHNEWISVLNSKEAYGSNNFTMVSLGAQPPPKKPQDTKQETKPPSSVPPKPTGQYFAASNTVKRIQEELGRIADILDSIGKSDPADIQSLRNVGSPPNVTVPDGKFGKNTRDALAKAEDLRRYHIDKYKPTVNIPAITSAPDASNVTSLQALQKDILRIKGGAGFKQQVKPLDMISAPLDGATLMVEEGTIPVTLAALVSLPVFYTFLINSGLLEQEFDQGQEVVNTVSLQNSLLWFMNRSQVVQQRSTNETRPMAVAYRRAVANLVRQFISVMQPRLVDGHLPPHILLDDLYKTTGQGTLVGGGNSQNGSDAPSSPGGGAGAGAGYKQIAGISGNSGSGKSGGMQVEFASGPDSYSVDDVPISRYIDLSNKEWWDINSDMLLDFNEYGRMNGKEFADTYFSGTQAVPPGLQLYHAAITTLPKEKVTLDPNTGRTFVLGQNGWLPAEQVPEVVQKYNQFNATPEYQASIFLTMLKSQISKVLNEWQSKVLESPEVRKDILPKMARSARLWIGHINRMIKQLGEGVRQLRGGF